MNTSYRDFLPFLRRELALLDAQRFELTFHQIHRVLAGEFGAATDRVLREYIPEQRWPQLEDPVRFELCLRLSLAIYWIEKLQGDTDRDGEPLPGFLTSTLIDYWQDDGRNRWVWEHYMATDKPW